jgi:hypothetical protein
MLITLSISLMLQEGADLQALVAEMLMYALFDFKGVPYRVRVTVDVPKLSPGTPSGSSKACSSCMQNWVLKSSMAVAQDHDLLVHCHMCLHELDGLKATQPAYVRQKQHLIWFAVASRYVGKFVACPLMRIISKEGLAGKKDAAFGAHLKVLSGVDQGNARRAADDARRRSGSSSSSGKADIQSVLDGVQYSFDDGATGMFSWVDSAWFQAWGPALVVLTLVLMLFVDWWISQQESYLHGGARRLGLIGRAAPATSAPDPTVKKAAASAGSAAAKKQQQGKGGKQSKKRQAAKADSRGRSNHSGSSSRSQAPGREQSSEAGTNSSTDQNGNSATHQQHSRGSSEESEWEVQLRPLRQEQQQQQQQQPGPPSSSANQQATPAQPTTAAALGKGESQENLPQLLCQGYTGALIKAPPLCSDHVKMPLSASLHRLLLLA